MHFKCILSSAATGHISYVFDILVIWDDFEIAVIRLIFEAQSKVEDVIR